MKSKSSAKKPTKRVMKTRTIKKPTTNRAKFKVGEFVYSTENRTEKRQINDVRIPKTKGGVIKYRLTLSDPKGKPKNSRLIAEGSIRKTKKS